MMIGGGVIEVGGCRGLEEVRSVSKALRRDIRRVSRALWDGVCQAEKGYMYTVGGWERDCCCSARPKKMKKGEFSTNGIKFTVHRNRSGGECGSPTWHNEILWDDESATPVLRQIGIRSPRWLAILFEER